MDSESTLPILGKSLHAVYVPYGSGADPSLLARGLASSLSPPAKVFSVESDLLTAEQGQELVRALTSSSAVVIYGSSSSTLIQAIGHYWPDYVDHCSNWNGSLALNVNLTSSSDRTALASVYLLIPEMTDSHRSHRPGVLPISSEDVEQYISRGSESSVHAVSLGYVYAGVSVEVSMRELCLLHERDPEGARPSYASWQELASSSTAFSWTDLQTILKGDPDHSMVDNFRSRLTPEMYAFGHSAIDFIWRFRTEMEGQVFPDIYSAIWRLEHAFQPGTVFRGQYQSKWGLECSLLRPPNEGSALDAAELMKRIRLTSRFLSAAKEREEELFGGAMDERSLVAVAQHFGFPTPLLDFTESFKIAAFFATLGAQRRASGDSTIGVIFYNTSPLEEQLMLTDQADAQGLHDFAGIRLGTLHVIRPTLPHADDRIRRQQGVFIAGYRARDLQAVTIDRIYFKQQPGVTFQDPRAGVSRSLLLPEDTTLSAFAAEVKRNVPAEPPIASYLLGQTPIGDSSVVGSTGSHLYWHLLFGQTFLRDLRHAAERHGVGPLSAEIEGALRQYFDLARVEAGISIIPDDRTKWTRLVPIEVTIAALERAAGLPEDEIWKLLRNQLPRGFEAGGVIQLPVPDNWAASAHLAFSCALFCVAWEHLRQVPGLRAQELVQSATRHLHRL